MRFFPTRLVSGHCFPIAAWLLVILPLTTEASVEFSRASGVFAEATIEVRLQPVIAAEGQVIRFTTDGSLPGPDAGRIYEEPLQIATTTQVRAVAIGGDGEAGEVATASFIRLAADVAGYQSRLPILVIENFGGGTIPAKGWNSTGAGIRQLPRQAAVWAVFERDGGDAGQADLLAPPQMLSRIGIRGRGAFSTTWRQKPYSVEAWRDADDEERDVAPLDFPAHSDWVLYFPDPDQNKDPAMVHNTFIYELSTLAGRYACRFRWMDVFINEDGGDLRLADRRGVYALLEKVSRGRERLDFNQLSEDGTSGGFLLNLNRMDAEYEGGWPAPNGATRPQFFHTAGPNRRQDTPPNVAGRGDDIPRQSNGFLNFDNPNGYRINEAQRAAIENWFVTFEDVLYDNAIWKDPELGYRHYIDADDFVTYFVFHNLSRNGDGLLISMFPWVSSRDGRLRMGPAWDYNWSSYDVSGGPTSTAMHRSDRLWYGRLFRDPDFMQLYIDKWFDMRRGAMSNESMAAIIERQAAEIGDAFGVAQGFRSASAWSAARARMIDWLQRRADWLDAGYTAPPVFNQLGGHVEPGFQVILSAADGVIHYTTDGTDPRLPGGSVSPAARQVGGTTPLPLIGADTALRLRVPDSAADEAEWRQPGFDDSGWQSGSGGVGYDSPSGGYEALIDTDVGDAMRLVNGSVYIRVPFHIDALDPVLGLTLGVRYDDGFAAFLNGVPVIAANAPSPLGWNSTAAASHPDDEAAEFQMLEKDTGPLREGDNVLAIQAMNSSASGSDFLCEVELEASLATVDTGLVVERSRRIVARALDGNDWSARTVAQFLVGAEPAAADNLALSEIHYHPADPAPEELAPGDPDAENYEFIELLNTGASPVDLSGVTLDDGVVFRFAAAPVQLLEPGARVVVVAREETFRKRYGAGAMVAGEYSGHLANGGERLLLRAGDGSVISDVTFSDRSPWPEAADGAGASLTLVSTGSDPREPASWAASGIRHGTPGTGEGKSPPDDPRADADGDGVSALLEYVAGTSDNDPSEGQGAFSLQATDAEVVVRLQRDPDAPGVGISLEESEDLQTWQPSNANPSVEPTGITWTFGRSPRENFVRLKLTRD